jgi:hypothetical protein
MLSIKAVLKHTLSLEQQSIPRHQQGYYALRDRREK